MAMAHVPARAKTGRRSGQTAIQESRALSGEEKAIFHNLTGAGTSRVLRPFMGLTEDDESYLTERLGEGINRLLAGER